MIKYVERVWINGSFPPSSWNVYQHDGETTNNIAEGYNRKIEILIWKLLTITGSHTAHPNFFQFTELGKKELLVSADEITMAEQGN